MRDARLVARARRSRRSFGRVIAAGFAGYGFIDAAERHSLDLSTSDRLALPTVPRDLDRLRHALPHARPDGTARLGDRLRRISRARSGRGSLRDRPRDQLLRHVGRYTEVRRGDDRQGGQGAATRSS